MTVTHPSELFLFDWVQERAPHATDTVAFASSTVESQALVERLRSHHLMTPPPESIVLFGSESQKDALLELASDDSLLESLPRSTRYSDPPGIRLATFNRNGLLRWIGPKGGITPFSRRDSRALWRTGLVNIFDSRHGLLEGAGYHWVNPSGRHTRGFIRAGNVLLHSAEVAFLAAGLLQWWKPSIRRVFTDTASINAVAYAVIDLLRDFDHDLRSPTIDSFSSYGGLTEFNFDATDAFCLISASTSGNLERNLVSNRLLPPDRIVTLYYLGQPDKHAQVLCDLTDSDHLAIESFDSVETCEFCRRGSTTIHISGDQFLPAGPQVKSLVVEHNHAPPWLPEVLDSLLGHDAIRCHAGHEGTPESVRETYLALDRAIAEPGTHFARSLAVSFLSAIPAATKVVLHSTDPSSTALARLVADHVETFTSNEPKTISISELEQAGSPEDAATDGAIVAVAGVVASGRSILSLSQTLRTVEKGHLAYVIGLSRTRSKESWKRLRSSLSYGARPREYPLTVSLICQLPFTDGRSGTPWSWELRDLTEWRETLSIEDERGAETTPLEPRITAIRDAESADNLGLDRVFLPRIQDGTFDFDDSPRLGLRNGFVFWRAVDRGLHPEPETSATESEVYFTISSVLHGLRAPQPGGSALVQHEHNRTVLSPINFARFNDGIIQAAFLRAAHPPELDYSHDATLSGEMADMLYRFAERREEREGEAFPEFLLALAQGRLRVMRRDTLPLADKFLSLELPPALALFAKAFKTRFAS